MDGPASGDPSTTDATFSFPVGCPFALSDFPATFILAFLLIESQQWLVSQHPENSFSCSPVGLAPRLVSRTATHFQS